MDDEKDAFYVVRKGDIIGIYKTFADCQAQAGFSPLDPSISVYKGYGLSKAAESYLVSRGLQQAGFSISACDVQDGLFGRLSVCPFQDAGESSCSVLNAPNKPVKLENYVEPQSSVSPNGRSQKHHDTALNKFPATYQQDSDKLKNYVKPVDLAHSSFASAESGSSISNPQRRVSEQKNHMESQQLVLHASVSAEAGSLILNPQKRVCELKNYMEPQDLVRPAGRSCTIEFDGASKGNPGPAGAGAILRAIDGSEVWLLREGVGIATNNVAEYRSVILGLNTALLKGFKHVKVRGDSMLVCNQIQGKWKTKNENMANLCKDALLLKKQFLSFTIEHVPREWNSAADAQANRAIRLRDGQVEIEMATSHA